MPCNLGSKNDVQEFLEHKVSEVKGKQKMSKDLELYALKNAISGYIHVPKKSKKSIPKKHEVIQKKRKNEIVS